jgi:hypothetical protein
MVSWHLLTHPSFPRWLAFLVIQPFNFVAEGFVLLAGTGVGLHMSTRPSPALRFIRRAASLLLVNYVLVIFIILIAAAGHRFGLNIQPATIEPSWWNVVTLRYQPYLGDVLTVFVFLFASVPLFQLVYRWGGGIALAALSAALFLSARVFPLNAYGAFVYNSWQIFFVAGMLLGLNYDNRIRAWSKTSVASIAGWVLLFALLAGVRAFVVGPDDTQLPGWQSILMFSRKPLTPARIVYIGVEMFLIALVTVKWWDKISSTWIVNAIARFGPWSLEVFVVSVVLDYVLKALCTGFGVGFPVNLFAWLGELLLLYGLTFVLASRAATRRQPPLRAATGVSV